MEALMLFLEINSYENKKPSIAANGVSRSKRRRLIKKEKWWLKKDGKKTEPSNSVSSALPTSSTSPPPSSTSPPCTVLSPSLPSDGEGEVFEKVPSPVAGIEFVEEFMEKKKKTPDRPYVFRLRPRSRARFD